MRCGTKWDEALCARRTPLASGAVA